ncbi:MAG: GAF domain-containing protein [Anaerolineaceae bacterium]|nr:GAF domain-containing protein [Anaerolineaceae bacterium]
MLAKIIQFIAPPQFPDDDEKTRIANLLNLLLWLFFSVFLVLAIVLHLIENSVLTTTLIASVAIVSLLLLFVLRQRYVRAASWLTVLVFYTGTFSAAFFDSGMNLGVSSSLLTLGVLVGLMLGRHIFNIYAVLTVLISSLVLYLESTGQLSLQVRSELPNYLSTGANFFILAITLNLTLRDLQNASNRIRQNNKELLSIRDHLEQTVTERTRDLALAAEVGRSVSQIRELDALLQNAVNTIQKQFDLYYIQIYLADKRQKTLMLKAGTGIVGRQLVRRGHVLTVSNSSINGTAAAEKRTVIVSNTAVSPMFKPNSLLPFTRSEMAVPLILGEQVMGVLNLQSDAVDGLTEQNANAFETLAGQLAVAIENANLFTETQEARAQVEEYVGLVVQQGWENYQDGITQPELLGFTFAGEKLQRLTQSPPAPEMGIAHLDVPIVVANEMIGTIQLEAEMGHTWTDEEKEMVTAVARQVGQQAENLRLLAETYQYRTEAEKFARRLSGEAWREFVHGQGKVQQGFVYDQNKIQPLSPDSPPALPEADLLRQPLQVQEETIGEIIVAGAQNLEDAALVTAVSQQLSSHIENLRLAQQTELALAQTDILYRIGRDLNTANNEEDILLAALNPILPTAVSEATLMFVELDSNNEPETLHLLAGWQRQGRPAYPVGTHFPVKQFPFAGLFLKSSDAPQLISEVTADERIDDVTQAAMAQASIQAIALIPLTVAQQWVGIITFSWSEAHPFTRQEQEIFNALINIVAPTVQSQRLFAKTKSQADKERLINIINQRIQSTASIDSALQTAVKELGKALQTTTQVKLTTAAPKQKEYEQKAVAAD